MEIMEQKPQKLDGKFVVIGVLILALGLANFYAIRQANRAQERLDQVQRSLETRLLAVSEQAQAVAARADRTAADLDRQLQEARRTVTSTAERRTAQLVDRLAAEYRQQQSAMVGELGEVKQAATTAHQKAASVADEVNTVRGDVAQTRSELENTRVELKTELKSVKGDLGIQSGLIATNARELAALRELGERHYFEFAIAKTGRPYKIANLSVILRRTDPKRNRFTLDVLADDKRIEKKDKNLNEPVQFYVAGARQPYELVVNAVKKDQIVGYLAVPKVLEAAAH